MITLLKAPPTATHQLGWFFYKVKDGVTYCFNGASNSNRRWRKSNIEGIMGDMLMLPLKPPVTLKGSKSKSKVNK